jgi:hypothetical protein
VVDAETPGVNASVTAPVTVIASVTPPTWSFASTGTVAAPVTSVF